MPHSYFRTAAPSLSQAGPRQHRDFPARLPTLRLSILLLATVLASAAHPAAWQSGAIAAGDVHAAPAGAWTWPLRPDPGVVRPFDAPAERWLAGHRGVDLAGALGDAVHSPADGTVRFAGPVVDRGVLTVDHGDGTVSSFEPVTATVAVGDPVTAGQPIGLLAPRKDSPSGGSPETGQPHCPGSCLHWGVRLDGEYVDPLRYVTDRRPSVLFPLAGGPGG